MDFRKWVLGAVAAGLALGAAGAQAAPVPVTHAEAPASVQTVQFFYYDDPPPPPVYYDPPPRRYYGPPPGYYRPPPPPRTYYGPPRYGYWDKEAAKDYVKDYRRTQKEIYKERVRAWNRANGY